MKNKNGQTALVLILITAAALIFLAITINWGRIAQTKALLTIAADQGASMLASDLASYGEMEKQTYLNDQNQKEVDTNIFIYIALIVVAIIITIFSWGTAAPFLVSIIATEIVLVASVIMAITNLILQICVVQPMITEIWNKLQKNQTDAQIFFEQGLSTALESSVTDQVNITDYFDSNANGVFGSTNNLVNDNISRFALFYSDRLKMLNQASPPFPQVVFFYNQLGELMNGVTCTENANDAHFFGAPINPACVAIDNKDGSGQYCFNDAIDPACTAKIPNGPNQFQLNDACTGSNPLNTATYTPYCDPCCQPQYVPGSSPPQVLRPTSCLSGDSNCSTNNPYNAYGSYPDIYAPSFQNDYSPAGPSFLDQFGMDQQMGPFTTNLTPQGNPTNNIYFPSGIYPFFWLMKDYSPQVDNINSNPAIPLQPSQYHWCTAPASTPLTVPSVAQLKLNYTCSGQACCVNFLEDTLSNSAPGQSNSLTIVVGSGPTIALNVSGSSFTVNGNVPVSATASEAAPGSVNTFNVVVNPGSSYDSATAYSLNLPESPSTPTTSVSISGSANIPQCATFPTSSSPSGVVMASGAYTITAIATDANGNTSQSSTTVNLNNPYACSSANTCGTDGCGNICGICPGGTKCNSTTGPGTCVSICLECQTWNGSACESTTPCGTNTCGKDSCNNSCGPSCAPKTCMPPGGGPGTCQ